MRDFRNMIRCKNCGKIVEPVEYVSLKDVARLIGVHYNTIYKNKKKFGAVYRLGGWRVAMGRVEEFMMRDVGESE